LGWLSNESEVDDKRSKSEDLRHYQCRGWKGGRRGGGGRCGIYFLREEPAAGGVGDGGKDQRTIAAVLDARVFVDAPEDFVAAAIQSCGLTLAQFHGAETPDYCAQFGVMTMKAFRVKDAASLAGIRDYRVDAILLDSYVAGQTGGTGEKFNWDLAVEAKRFGKPIFLAGGLTPENVAQAVSLTRPFAVDVSSGVEKSPGTKDHDKVRRFIGAVRGVRF
jgi:phosphoribosylanthranilate isomerase